MGNWRAWRSLAVVTCLVGAFSATTMVSCGGGGGNDSNGGLCEQCGDTDGPCNIAGADIEPGQAAFPSFCTNPQSTCHVTLVCTRKLDSAQRRCFPADSAGALDLRYECDGSRPQATPVPTGTATPTGTVTESPTPTTSPTSTGPTPTGVTPTASATPATTATPGGPQDLDVTVSLTTDADNLTDAFSLTVTYPASKGTFGGASVSCEDDAGTVQATDNGSGTLIVSIPGDPDGFSGTDVVCVFHQLAGQTLLDTDLTPTLSNSAVTVDNVDVSPH